MNHSASQSANRELVFQIIRDSWSAETSGNSLEWSPDNPSWQQCDASAFVAWEHLGGELVLGKVFLNGQETEYHYWNRIDGVDFDLTRDQFIDGQDIEEVEVLSNSFLQQNASSMKPEVLQRITILRHKVNEALCEQHLATTRSTS